MMKLFEYLKIAVSIIVIIQCALATSLSLPWIVSCVVFCVIFYSYIPAQNRYLAFLLLPLLVTIVAMQLLTGFFSGTLHHEIIIITSFKILGIGLIIIGARFFIGINGFKALINILPQPLKLFFLIFMRILYKLLRLNTMIVFQLQSRIDFKSTQKYYIPKYYSVAFVTNQFYALSYYRNGILSRSFDSIPQLLCNDTICVKDIASVFILLAVSSINMYL